MAGAPRFGRRPQALRYGGPCPCGFGAVHGNRRRSVGTGRQRRYLADSCVKSQEFLCCYIWNFPALSVTEPCFITIGQMSRDLTRALLRYCEPSVKRALLELAVTALPLVLLWVLMWLSLDVGYWLTLLLAVPAAGFMVRLFIIQHDCGHGAFFRQRAANSWVGRVLGVLTLTPYDYWKHNHAVHHATSGNLDRRGIGDIDTLTVEEYRSR